MQGTRGHDRVGGADRAATAGEPPVSAEAVSHLLDEQRVAAATGNLTRVRALHERLEALGADLPTWVRSVECVARAESWIGLPGLAAERLESAAAAVRPAFPNLARSLAAATAAAWLHAGEVDRAADALATGDGTRDDEVLLRALVDVCRGGTGVPDRLPTPSAIEGQPDLAMIETWRRAWTGDVAGARSLIEPALTAARALDDPLGVVNLLAALAELELLEGNWPHALARAAEARDVAIETGHHNVEARALATLAAVHARRGAEQDCRLVARQALDRVGEAGVTSLQVIVRASLGQLELSLGNLDAAVLELLVARRLAGAGGMRSRVVVRHIADLVEAMVLSGRLEEARSIVREDVEAVAGCPHPYAQAVLWRTRALVGAADEAEACFEASLEAHDRDGSAFETGRTLLCLGRSRIARAEGLEARDALERAAVELSAAGATQWVELARAALRDVAEDLDRVTLPASETDPADDPAREPEDTDPFSGLTPAERAVAEAVTAGLTNAEVAAQLFISTKTVETHLTNAYRKLGVSSRSQLVRLAAGLP